MFCVKYFGPSLYLVDILESHVQLSVSGKNVNVPVLCVGGEQADRHKNIERPDYSSKRSMFRTLVSRAGFEPAAQGLKGPCSARLS